MTELNLCSIISISKFNEFYFFVMIFNCVNLEHTVIFVKYVARAASLRCQQTLTINNFIKFLLAKTSPVLS